MVLLGKSGTDCQQSDKNQSTNMLEASYSTPSSRIKQLARKLLFFFFFLKGLEAKMQAGLKTHAKDRPIFLPDGFTWLFYQHVYKRTTFWLQIGAPLGAHVSALFMAGHKMAALTGHDLATVKHQF